MTRPHEGDAFIGVHADTSPYEREADRGIRRASEDLEDTTLKDVGKDFGDTLSKSMGDELEKSGPELVRRVEKGLEGRRVRWKVKTTVDKDNNVVRRVVEETFTEIEDAFNKASGPGGPFDRIGRGVADAIGAGFNVSGRSSLIILLIPLIGVIVNLILAAVQAANALVAVLATVPALIAGIGIQVGALAFAFHGMGEAIQGAFAAKNAKELNEAIKNLTPSAQRFVRELLPIRDLFSFIARQTQESFFANLGSILPQLQKTLGRALGEGFPRLAAALGQLFRDLALFFASPSFVKFVNTLFPATIEFLQFFGPNLIKFLQGLVNMSTAILPFLNTLGRMLSGTLFQLGDFFDRLARSSSFQDWLDSMTETLQLVLELIGGVIDFFAVLFAQLDAAGGKDVLQSLIDAIELLTFFLSTDVGRKALEGLIHIAIMSIEVFTGIVLAILLVSAALEAFAEWLTGTAVPAIGAALEWLGGRVVWLFETIGGALLGFFEMVGGAIITGFNAIKKFFTDFWHTVTGTVANLEAAARSLPGKILGALGNFGNLLFEAGRSLIDGLIRGIKNKFGPLASAIDFAAQIIRDHWPFSPAKKGPLSGSGDPMIAGQKTMERFAEGIRMEIPQIQAASSEATSNIVFGRDAIRVTFEGALPTQQQAEQTGAAVGAGINGRLAARDTRLAVRTM